MSVKFNYVFKREQTAGRQNYLWHSLSERLKFCIHVVCPAYIMYSIMRSCCIGSLLNIIFSVLDPLFY